MSDKTDMYEELSADYDRFVNWSARLPAELPFLQRQLAQVAAHRVLDAACGTGQHAIALANLGYELVGTDLSPRMIEQANRNARAAGAAVRFEQAGLGHLAAVLEPGFDAILCLGNSLPHLLSPAELTEALADFAHLLRRGGLLVIQNRNFDRILAQQERWMEPQAHREGNKEWLFLRFYDFLPSGLLQFQMVTLYREEAHPWLQRVSSAPLWPQRRLTLQSALHEAGFSNISCFGDLSGAVFDAEDSPNLVLCALTADGVGNSQPGQAAI